MSFLLKYLCFSEQLNNDNFDSNMQLEVLLIFRSSKLLKLTQVINIDLAECKKSFRDQLKIVWLHQWRLVKPPKSVNNSSDVKIQHLS